MPEIPKSTHEDIYKTWGKNKTRVDSPVYGPEFAEWKKGTPLDIQKTTLDYMTARKIEVALDQDKKSKLLADQIPKEEYEAYREGAISEAKQVADSVSEYLTNEHPELVSSLLAVGLDGSSLYRPRRSGDIDVWIMFREGNKQIQDVLMDYFKEVQEPQWLTKKVEIRPASLHQTQEAENMGSVHCLALPHKIVRSFNLEEDEYKQAVDEAKESVRKSRKKIYDRSRYLVKLQRKNRE